MRALVTQVYSVSKNPSSSMLIILYRFVYIIPIKSLLKLWHSNTIECYHVFKDTFNILSGARKRQSHYYKIYVHNINTQNEDWNKNTTVLLIDIMSK